MVIMDEPIPQDSMIIIETEDCDAWQMQEGLLLIGRSDQFVSQGFVDINPKATLPKKSRPVEGVFKQMAGSSVFRVYEGDAVKEEKTLKTGDVIKVPANAPYSIENPAEGKCVVYWKFDGDVHEIFEQLKKQLPKAPTEMREKSGYKELFAEHQKRRQDEDAHIEGNY